MLHALLLLIAAEGPPVAAVDTALAEPDPKAMTQKEIREFNARLPRDHPYHIRCKRETEQGSLFKQTYSCRTNQQWEQAFARGNEDARDLVDKMRPRLPGF